MSGITAFLARTEASLKPQLSSSLKAAMIDFSTLSQLSSNTRATFLLKFFTWNLMLSLNSTRQVFRIKSSLITKFGFPMAKTFFTVSGNTFLASLFFQFAVVIDISRLEKLNGSPPLFVLIKISSTVSISWLSSR